METIYIHGDVYLYVYTYMRTAFVMVWVSSTGVGNGKEQWKLLCLFGV